MKRALLAAAATTLLSSQAFAAVDVAWTDWTSSAGLTTATGVISVGGKDVTVTWSGPRASFVQTSGGIDYWQNSRSGRDASTSAYTSTSAIGNTNIPTDTDIVALWFGGTSTLTFSEAVSGLYFSYVSINGNSYDFSEDLRSSATPARTLTVMAPMRAVTGAARRRLKWAILWKVAARPTAPSTLTAH